MRRMTVSIAGFIVLVIPLLGQTYRQDATKFLRREWWYSPAVCVKALELVVEEQCPVCGLKELKKGLEKPLEHALQVYDEASKFDDFWVLVATALRRRITPRPQKAATTRPIPKETARSPRRPLKSCMATMFLSTRCALTICRRITCAPCIGCWLSRATPTTS